MRPAAMTPRAAQRFAVAALVLCMALGASKAVPHSRRLAQANAVSNANAVAGPGQTSSATSGAEAVSTGKPTFAGSNATAIPSPGQSTATVNCLVFAKDQVKYNNCINTPDGAARELYISLANAPPNATSWENAPACSTTLLPTTSTAVKDTTKEQYWGFENGKSCAYKKPDGTPILPAASSVPWESAPLCVRPFPGVADKPDFNGRCWGFEGNSSCAYRNPDLTTTYPNCQKPGSSSPAPAASTPAPVPSPTPLPAPASGTGSATANAQANAIAG